ncbi:MAG TPA: hypothetical protein VKN36_08390 [Eudoraea sp.]|nr:hypothetical protein [Eudoraea sp.]
MDRDLLIERFIQGTLTVKEQREFDTLVRNDNDFKEEVEFHINVGKVSEAEDDDNFRKLLSEFESEALKERSGTKKFTRKWMVAASLILIAGIACFFIIMQPPTTQELFDQSFVPYRNVVHTIVRGEQVQDTRTKAFSSYAAGEYEASVSLFSALYEDEKTPYYLFYKANALIQLNRAEEAIPLLKEHMTTNDSLADKSAWYLAMAYLQLNDRENAIKMLKDVVGDGGFNTAEASQLLEDLD